MTRSAILPIALSVGLCIGAILLACAPDPGPFFTPGQWPENPSAFAGGRLGLLTPALSKSNELIAFRLLSGRQVAGGLEGGNGQAGESPGPIGQPAWIGARRAFPDTGRPAPQFIDTYRQSPVGTSYVFYPNCLDDAFKTAAATLEDRRRHYPSRSAVTAWVLAQDQVFANCSGKATAYPEGLASGAPPLPRADRDYQIAAAHFYAEDLPEAERRFRIIAADVHSPWRRTAEYMVGRTMLREVSLGKNAGAAALAREQFAKIANDPSAGNLAESARGLLQHLDAIEHADAVMESLSKQLLQLNPGRETLTDTMHQSVYVLTSDRFSKALAQPDLPEAFDWVRTLESENEAHALDKWKAGRSLPWLTLSLMYMDGKDLASTDLIEQADRLAADSPAFGTARYNAIRLRLERGETGQPRKQLDALLADAKLQPDSLVNAWRAERMRVATGFDDLLRWAPRKPVYVSDYIAQDPRAASSVLAPDSAYILNYLTPLSKLAAAAHSSVLPPWVTTDMAIATWTRAFMLNDSSIVSSVAPIIAKAHPDWSSTLTPGPGEQREAWRFRAALMIALQRDFTPLKPVDYRTRVAWNRGSWWCPVTARVPGQLYAPGEVAWRLPAIFTPSEAVISAHEQSVAASERERLQNLGSAQTFLAPIIMAWAKSHPDDPLVPQALHRLVFVVRYGCYNQASNGRISKAAYDLLHSRYPGNEWTAKTPYWFN